jgi:hypothetical protein
MNNVTLIKRLENIKEVEQLQDIIQELRINNLKTKTNTSLITVIKNMIKSNKLRPAYQGLYIPMNGIYYTLCDSYQLYEFKQLDDKIVDTFKLQDMKSDLSFEGVTNCYTSTYTKTIDIELVNRLYNYNKSLKKDEEKALYIILDEYEKVQVTFNPEYLFNIIVTGKIKEDFNIEIGGSYTGLIFQNDIVNAYVLPIRLSEDEQIREKAVNKFKSIMEV